MNFQEHKKQIMSKWTWHQKLSYWIELKLAIIWIKLRYPHPFKVKIK